MPDNSHLLECLTVLIWKHMKQWSHLEATPNHVKNGLQSLHVEATSLSNFNTDENARSMAHQKFKPGLMAALICLDAEYICLTRGMRLMNHSPTQSTDAPIQDETNTPTKKMKITVVTNPSPAVMQSSYEIFLKLPSVHLQFLRCKGQENRLRARQRKATRKEITNQKR